MKKQLQNVEIFLYIDAQKHFIFYDQIGYFDEIHPAHKQPVTLQQEALMNLSFKIPLQAAVHLSIVHGFITMPNTASAVLGQIVMKIKPKENNSQSLYNPWEASYSFFLREIAHIQLRKRIQQNQQTLMYGNEDNLLQLTPYLLGSVSLLSIQDKLCL